MTDETGIKENRKIQIRLRIEMKLITEQMVGIWKQTKEKKTDHKSEKPRQLQYPLLKARLRMIIIDGRKQKKNCFL